MRRILDLPAATADRLPTGAELATVTPEQRIAAVWPLVCKKATDFVRTLKPRERVNWDLEDVAQTIWVALRAKDHKWSADRGKYVTFAAVVIHSELCSIRDRAGTVEGPRNVVDRLREYQAEEDAGTITPIRARTFESIRRVVGEFKPVADDHLLTELRPDEEAEVAELEQGRHDAVVAALGALTPLEARVTGLAYGLWGQPERTMAEITATVGCRAGAVKQARRSAEDKIRERLREAGHRWIASDN